DLVLMKKKGIVLVGTDFSETAMKPLNITDPPLHSISVERLKKALKAGVTMAFGSDVFAPVPGMTRGAVALSYLDSFKEAGVPAKTVLQMFTVNAARLLGVDKERGFVKEGFAADLIAMKGNPLEDPSVLKRVDFVMKDGRVVRK